MSRPESTEQLREMVMSQAAEDYEQRRANLSSLRMEGRVLGGVCAASFLFLAVGAALGSGDEVTSLTILAAVPLLMSVVCNVVARRLGRELRSLEPVAPEVAVSSSLDIGGNLVRNFRVGNTRWVERYALPEGEAALAAVARHAVENARIHDDLVAGRLPTVSPGDEAPEVDRLKAILADANAETGGTRMALEPGAEQRLVASADGTTEETG